MKNFFKTFVSGTAPALLIAGGAAIAADQAVTAQTPASHPATQPSTGPATRPVWPNLPPGGGIEVINGIRN